MKKVLIIIPAYNEEKNIIGVVDNIINNFPQYDYVVVNDGSKDSTADLCVEKGYNLLDLPINVGLAGAFQCGMKYAKLKGYEYAIQYDADGQHRAEFIEPMLDEAIKEKCDIVVGSRFKTEKKEFSARMIGSRFIAFSILITTGKKITDPTSGMRLYSKTMIDDLASKINHGPEPDTLAYFIRKKYKVSEVQVTMDERIEGESYLTFGRSIKYMTKMMISILLVQWFRA